MQTATCLHVPSIVPILPPFTCKQWHACTTSSTSRRDDTACQSLRPPTHQGLINRNFPIHHYFVELVLVFLYHKPHKYVIVYKWTARFNGHADTLLFASAFGVLTAACMDAASRFGHSLSAFDRCIIGIPRFCSGHVNVIFFVWYCIGSARRL